MSERPIHKKWCALHFYESLEEIHYILKYSNKPFFRCMMCKRLCKDYVEEKLYVCRNCLIKDGLI